MFELALRSLALGGRQVAITNTGDQRVSFNLVDFYSNSSRLLGVNSNALTAQQVKEVADELRVGFETNALQPPAIEIVRERGGCVRESGLWESESQTSPHLLMKGEKKGAPRGPAAL